MGKRLRKYMERWIQAWTQEHLRKVFWILTHLAVFLCPQIKCQIGVIKVITNICLIHSTVITQWRSFCSMIYNFHNNPGEEMIWYYGYFTDRKTWAYRNKVTCLRPRNCEGQSQGLDLDSSALLCASCGWYKDSRSWGAGNLQVFLESSWAGLVRGRDCGYRNGLWKLKKKIG